jgi:hypothetical protein
VPPVLSNAIFNPELTDVPTLAVVTRGVVPTIGEVPSVGVTIGVVPTVDVGVGGTG